MSLSFMGCWLHKAEMLAGCLAKRHCAAWGIASASCSPAVPRFTCGIQCRVRVLSRRAARAQTAAVPLCLQWCSSCIRNWLLTGTKQVTWCLWRTGYSAILSPLATSPLKALALILRLVVRTFCWVLRIAGGGALGAERSGDPWGTHASPTRPILSANSSARPQD